MVYNEPQENYHCILFIDHIIAVVATSLLNRNKAKMHVKKNVFGTLSLSAGGSYEIVHVQCSIDNKK